MAKATRKQQAAQADRPAEKKAPPQRHEPNQQTRNLVSVCMLAEFTHEQTARLVGISKEALQRHYADELAKGKERMIAIVAGNLYSIATQQQDRKAALTASIFILKSKGGFNDRAAQDAEASVDVPGGGTIKVTLRIGDRLPTAD